MPHSRVRELRRSRNFTLNDGEYPLAVWGSQSGHCCLERPPERRLPAGVPAPHR